MIGIMRIHRMPSKIKFICIYDGSQWDTYVERTQEEASYHLFIMYNSSIVKKACVSLFIEAKYI